MSDYAGLVKLLKITPLYEGSGEESNLPETAADAIEALVRERDEAQATALLQLRQITELVERTADDEAVIRRERDEARAALRKVQARTYSADRQCALKADAVAEICDIVSAALTNKGGRDE